MPAELAVASAATVAIATALAAPAGLSLGAGEPAMTRSAHYLVRPEGRIAYDDEGTGPLVVLVPGLGDLRAEYRFLAPRLVAAGYRVVAVDLRGHGQSSTGWSDYTSSAIGADVVALVEGLDAGPATLVGTSMGAAAVAWAAAEAPSNVAGAVLIGPFVRDVPPKSWIAGIAQTAMIRAALSGPWSLWAWGKVYGTFYATKPADFDAYRTSLVANLAESGRMEALRGMAFASKMDVERRLHEVRAPVLVVMGTKDPDFADPQAEANTVAQLLRGRTVMIEGAGHYPQVEQPDAVAKAIRGFLATGGEG
jgi:pimeloyl-ACP methyl ester carboxylesterase